MVAVQLEIDSVPSEAEMIRLVNGDELIQRVLCRDNLHEGERRQLPSQSE